MKNALTLDVLTSIRDRPMRLATQRGFLLPPEGFGSSSPGPSRSGKLGEWGEWAVLLGAVLGFVATLYILGRLLLAWSMLH